MSNQFGMHTWSGFSTVSHVFRGSNIHGSNLLTLTAGHFRLLAPTESILIPTGCIPTGAKLYPQNAKGTHTVTVRSGTLTWHEWGLWTKSPNLGNVSHKQGEVTANLWADTHTVSGRSSLKMIFAAIIFSFSATLLGNICEIFIFSHSFWVIFVKIWYSGWGENSPSGPRFGAKCRPCHYDISVSKGGSIKKYNTSVYMYSSNIIDMPHMFSPRFVTQIFVVDKKLLLCAIMCVFTPLY